MFAGIGRTIRRGFKELFYNSAGTLSLSRVLVAIAIIQADAIVWLAIFWAYHLTVTDKMEAGAQLVSAYFTGLSAILGTQVAGAIVAQIFQMKFGGSISGRQLDIDATRDAVTAGQPVPVVPDVADLVPSDPNEPRVAAETQAEPFVLDDPLKVELVEGDGK